MGLNVLAPRRTSDPRGRQTALWPFAPTRHKDQEITSPGPPQSNTQAELVTPFTVLRQPPKGSPAHRQTSGR